MKKQVAIGARMLYFIPYMPDYSQGIIFGIALSMVRDWLVGWRLWIMVEKKT